MNTKIKIRTTFIGENPDNHISSYEYEVECAKEYELLGLQEGFTEDELKKAYKKALIKYHPDKYNGDGEKFKQVTEAYLKFKELLQYKI